MGRFRDAAVVVVATLLLTGCGGSQEDDVARVLESYPHARAAGDARAACDAFSLEARREQSRAGGGFCVFLRETASEMTPEQRRRSGAAKVVRVEVEGDRATGYLQFGDCIVRTSESELRRDGSGDWRIERMGGVPRGSRRSASTSRPWRSVARKPFTPPCDTRVGLAVVWMIPGLRTLAPVGVLDPELFPRPLQCSGLVGQFKVVVSLTYVVPILQAPVSAAVAVNPPRDRDPENVVVAA